MQKKTCLPMSKNVGYGGKGPGEAGRRKSLLLEPTVTHTGVQGVTIVTCDFINNALINKLIY